MPAITESTRRKLSLLQLAEELGNVSVSSKGAEHFMSTMLDMRAALLLNLREILEKGYRQAC